MAYVNIEFVCIFLAPIIPYGYHAQVIHGFVEELVVNDDPEYQWIDKIRTPRASNEARQVVFLKLSAQVGLHIFIELSFIQFCFNIYISVYFSFRFNARLA